VGRSAPTLCGIGVACIKERQPLVALRVQRLLPEIRAFSFVRRVVAFLGVAVSHSGESARLYLGEHVAGRVTAFIWPATGKLGYCVSTLLGLAHSRVCGKVGPCRLARSNILCVSCG